MSKVTINDLLEAGCHFGHPTRRWNPKMKEYIFGKRNGIYIFDLTITMKKLQEANDFLFNAVAEGADILFVGTKRQAQDIILETSNKLDMFYVTERWMGGLLTNQGTMRKSVAKMKRLKEMDESGEISEKSKREASKLKRQLTKLERDLSGIAEMTSLPDVLFVVDVERESIAVSEANKLGIPVVAIVDTNSDPDGVDYLIPANDDALRSIQTILAPITETLTIAGEIKAKKLAEEEKKRAEEAAKRDAEREAKKLAEAEKREADKKEADDKKSDNKKEAKAKKSSDKKEAKPKETKVEKPKTEEPKAEEAPSEEAPAEETKAEDAPAE